MPEIICFPRGGRQNRVTKPPVSPTRRVANGSISGSAPASATRKLAIERAIDEQQQQQNQQYEVAESTAGSLTADVAVQSTRASVQDSAYFSAPGQAPGESDADGAVVRDQQAGGSKAEADDSDMLDLHDGGSGDAEESGDSRAGAENLVTDIDEAEMSEMVSGAVESYTGESSITVPRLANRAEQTRSSNHGVDMNLSVAAAAAAAAAAMASAKHLATAGLGSHRSRTETSSCRPQAPQAPSSEHTKDFDDGTIAPHPQSDLAATKELSRDDAPAIHNDPVSASPPNTCDLAYDSGYSRISVESALSRRLAEVPGMRLAHQRRPDQQLNLGRRSNVEALFAHIAGEEVAVPCKNCHKGHGPWTTCVIVHGQMCGSCANCWFNASGSRCSFHEAKTPMQFYPLRQSLGGNASVLSPTSAASAMNSQNRASPLTTGGHVARYDARHYSAQQQQHPHQYVSQNRSRALSSPHGLSRPSLAAATQPSTAAQQAAAAAAAAVAAQKLSYGSHLASLAPAAASGLGNGVTANKRLSNGNASASSPFHADLITSLLRASRSSSSGGGSDGGGEPSSDAVSAELAPLVTLMINRALAEVRNADQRGRDLMLVELAAKQLALSIVRLGEGVGAAGDASSVPGHAQASGADDTFPNSHEDGPIAGD